jgi:ParB/RepB/Spo0J family partition protein
LPPSKLNEAQVRDIRDRMAADASLTITSEARKAGIDRANLSRALEKLKAAEAPGTSGAGGDAGLAMLSYESISTSSLNPRKTFDPGELDELADSIAVNGLLQNLVVRDGPDGRFILVAGERRFRAIGQLHAEGRWDGPIPCLVIEADDASHLALALLENLHRQDVAPLEEADAFAQLQALDPATWTAQAIATRIGRTSRYVYQRLSMAKDLCEDAKTLLAAGMLHVEGARLLAAQPLDVQEQIIGERWPNWRDSETDPDLLDIVIEEDDEPLSTIEIRREIGYQERRAAAEKARQERIAALAAQPAGQPAPDDEADEDDNNDDVDEETPEEKSERLKKQADREEAWRKQSEAAEAKRAETMAKFTAVAYKLPTDYATPEAAATGNTCKDGCKFRLMLVYTAPHEFHVCMNPDSPRAGLLTGEDQAGRDCFKV